MDNLNLENPEYVDKLENVEKADIIKENVEKILEFCLLKENRTLRRENMDAYKQKCMREFSFMHQKYPTLFQLLCILFYLKLQKIDELRKKEK
jgi:hypothetical protein